MFLSDPCKSFFFCSCEVCKPVRLEGVLTKVVCKAKRVSGYCGIKITSLWCCVL